MFLFDLFFFLVMLFLLCRALTTWNYSTSYIDGLGMYKITPTYVNASYACAGLHTIR